MTENIVAGRFFRVLTNATNDIWDRLSFWKKASDVEFDDGNNMESYRFQNALKRKTAYSVGTVAYISTAPSWAMLKCTKAGTTAAEAPTTYSTLTTAGTVITDGTAKFTVYDVRPISSFSSNKCQIPTVSLVSEIDNRLTANGAHFYFDYHDGKYGYNTSANRSINTFVAF